MIYVRDMQKLWRVLYTFEVPGEHAFDYATEKYFIIASSEDLAKLKADEHFKTIPLYKDLNLAEQGYTFYISEYTKKLSMPRLTLENDRDRFKLKPKITKNDKEFYIEFFPEEN